MRDWITISALAALLVVASAPAHAHSNDVEADTQVSNDGTIVVENAFLLSDGYIVVHRVSENGSVGEPIGHRPIAEAQLERGVGVTIDDEVWADWGTSREVYVALHRDEGSTGFNASEDPIQVTYGERAATRISVRKADAQTVVLAARFEGPQETSTNNVTIKRVTLGSDGLVVVRRNASGRVLGWTRLPAGTSENVTVGVDGSVFASEGRDLTFFAQAYTGDGTPADASTTPVAVDGSPVGSFFDVERRGTIEATPETQTTADPTDSDTDHEGHDHTHEGTEDGEHTHDDTKDGSHTHDDDHGDHEHTEEKAETSETEEMVPTTEDGESATTPGASGAGFGFVALGAALTVLLLTRRR